MLWFVIVMQSIGLCRCIMDRFAVSEEIVVSGSEPCAAGCDSHLPGEPAGRIDCDAPVVFKAKNNASETDLAMLPPAPPARPASDHRAVSFKEFRAVLSHPLPAQSPPLLI